MSKKYGKMGKGDEFTEEIRKALIGWYIVKVGMTETYTDAGYKDKLYKGRVEGGLTLLLESAFGEQRKVIIGATELGLWLEHKEEL